MTGTVRGERQAVRFCTVDVYNFSISAKNPHRSTNVLKEVRILKEVEEVTSHYTQYPLQEIQLQEPVLEFWKKLETISSEILRLRDIKIAGNEF